MGIPSQPPPQGNREGWVFIPQKELQRQAGNYQELSKEELQKQGEIEAVFIPLADSHDVSQGPPPRRV